MTDQRAFIVEYDRIDYLLSPERFRLDIPVSCLASMSEHDITRMIGMLSDWIQRHKPPKPVLGMPDTALQQQLRDRLNAAVVKGTS